MIMKILLMQTVEAPEETNFTERTVILTCRKNETSNDICTEHVPQRLGPVNEKNTVKNQGAWSSKVPCYGILTYES